MLVALVSLTKELILVIICMVATSHIQGFDAQESNLIIVNNIFLHHKEKKKEMKKKVR